MNERSSLTITELNSYARDLLEGSFMPLWITGEIGTLTLARSGHVYMTLKDSGANVRAVFFGGERVIRQLALQTGSKVEAFGQISLYVAGGEFQFKIQMLKNAGTGDLQALFENIKKRLFEEGLFDQSRKKLIPKFPQKIGVITSAEGAALQDFLNVLTRRFPPIHVQIYPALVQGKSAHLDLMRGIDFFNKQTIAERVDLLILTRGGGSIEDLWAFNEEDLARAISKSQIPIVSAVGHEIDFTIADFVADLRAPTPSAAAELIIEPLESFEQRLDYAERQLSQNLLNFVQLRYRKIDEFARRLESFNPKRLLQTQQQQLEQIYLRMQHTLKNALQKNQHRLILCEQSLNHLSPKKILERGYAYVQNELGHIVSSAQMVHANEDLKITVKDGQIKVNVQAE